MVFVLSAGRPLYGTMSNCELFADIRFHSSPMITVTEGLPDTMLDDLRRSLAVPVSERRKFFETMADYNHSA
ncbi:hypothetical protein AB6A40_011221 [Gnathostoma spinigerum]|uniref:Uncharacterized protein n=1 Tax=Gnathostoma spinigerum TaxID=75299 RepID=A0ABD6F3R9_9BILA